MKKLLFLFIMFTIFLSGCSLLNLNDFVLPNDIEFINTIETLDAPEKICNYMKENFIYEPHLLYILNPYQLYITQKGDCDDFANFSIFISNYHGYETFLIRIKWKNEFSFHYIAIYKENGKYNYSSNTVYYPINVSTLKEIIEHCLSIYYEYEPKNYTIYDYNMNIIEQVIE